jgi:hypothetical protein
MHHVHHILTQGVDRVVEYINSNVEYACPDIVVHIMIKSDLLVGYFVYAASHWSTLYYHNCVGKKKKEKLSLNLSIQFGPLVFSKNS